MKGEAEHGQFDRQKGHASDNDIFPKVAEGLPGSGVGNVALGENQRGDACRRREHGKERQFTPDVQKLGQTRRFGHRLVTPGFGMSEIVLPAVGL